MLELFYKNEQKECYFFKANDKLIGQVFFTYEGRYIYDFHIMEKYRNQGYGSIMMKEIIENFGDRGLYLDVQKDNGIARHLYEKSGFVYKEDSRNDLLRMYLERD